MKHIFAAWAMGAIMAGTIACSDDTTNAEDDQASTQNSSGGSGGTGASSAGGMGGNGGSPTTGGNGGDGGQGGQAPFVLTSPSYMEGEVIPTQFTCDGANISPALNWGPGPAGTMSYALIFKDLDNGVSGFLHSTIWDINASMLSLPEDVDNVYQPPDVPGAKQSNSYSNGPRGYAGPCSPGVVNTYEFRLYAIPTATLAGLDMGSTLAQAAAAIQAAAIASTALSGES